MDEFRRRHRSRPDLAKNEIADDETNIPEGWPRPHYRLKANPSKRQYAQWSSDMASAQIMACNPNRTYMGGEHHLCSSCGAQMSKGLIFDRDALVAKGVQEGGVTYAYTVSRFDGEEEVEENFRLEKLNEADTHYGSPICFRCAIFAAKHCPYLAGLHEPFGDEFPWVVTTSGQDYREFDETSGLELLDPESLPRITTGQVRAAVQRGELHLTGLTAKDFGEAKRPMISDEFGFSYHARRDPTEENGYA